MLLRIVFPQMAERSLWALIVEKIEPAKAIFKKCVNLAILPV